MFSTGEINSTIILSIFLKDKSKSFLFQMDQIIENLKKQLKKPDDVKQEDGTVFPQKIPRKFDLLL